MFHADLDEIELDLSAFPNLVEFFVRALKHNARPIATNTNMVIILLHKQIITFYLNLILKIILLAGNCL